MQSLSRQTLLLGKGIMAKRMFGTGFLPAFFRDKLQGMNEDWQEKLRRLGVAKGVRHLKPAPPVAPPSERPLPSPAEPSFLEHASFDDPQPLHVLLPGGRLESTAEGECFIVDKVYPLTYRHGADTLADLFHYHPEMAGPFWPDGRSPHLHFRDCLFIDTETTGLAGAGTLAFMVGCAFFEPSPAGEVLVVRQYFLRDHGDELPMLLLLNDLLASKTAVITFNGRSFDLPLLDTRYLMNRLRTNLLNTPHLDLLQPSRRLWRNRLGSCSLGHLEQAILQVNRTQEDIPGWLIPGLYQQYLRSGDARELLRVFYHNQLDMLSMVTLTSRVLRLFQQADAGDHPLDIYSLGKWHLDLGLAQSGEQFLRQALQGDLPLEHYHKALFELAEHYKRNGRYAEALPLWQTIAVTTYDDITAHIELAKYYEWHAQDIATALQWTHQALHLMQSLAPHHPATLLQAEVQHRLARLQRKTNRPQLP